MYFWLLSSKLISHLSDPVCWKGFLYSCCFQILPTYCTLHELRFQHGPQREQTSAFVSKWAKPEVKSTFSKPEISTSGEVRMLFFPTQHSSSCELWFSPDGEAAEFCCHILFQGKHSEDTVFNLPSAPGPLTRLSLQQLHPLPKNLNQAVELLFWHSGGGSVSITEAHA